MTTKKLYLIPFAISCLVQAMENRSPLIKSLVIAVQTGDTARLEPYTSALSEVMLENGDTLLHMAIRLGSPTAPYIIAPAPELASKKNKENKTPKELAIDQKNPTLINLFLPVRKKK